MIETPDVTPPSLDTPDEHLSTNPPSKKHTQATLIFLTILVILLTIMALFFEKITNIAWLQDMAYSIIGKKNPNILPPPAPPPTPTPTPSYLPPGKQTYTISSQSKGPKVTSITLDPLDIHKGNTQSILVTIASDEAITEASITIYSDTKKTTIPLIQDKTELHASWKVDDSVNNRYIFKIDATNTSTSSSTMVAPRTNGPIRLNSLN